MTSLTLTGALGRPMTLVFSSPTPWEDFQTKSFMLRKYFLGPSWPKVKYSSAMSLSCFEIIDMMSSLDRVRGFYTIKIYISFIC